ncbi:DUF3558 domain-containing protein [Streptomyces sp. ISL-10]|uniref:DUF3558 domain-containing protein n=1 Tax=Streptomyces sp. ISL-10 TaxID=2819172 RepID=UPI001BE551B2|nr:DUF3558 domain-containing protein [Streptomyces sp. ISL-10]MBT2368724.1 DUF3558 domain-containing protein [Streptomyces sp. ISL-10]
MQRKAYVPGAAALLAALVTGVTGCTSGGGPTDSATDAKANGARASAAPPGRYRTLLEPCGSIERSTLKDLLPGVVTLPEDQQQQVLRGTPAVTYDTDRRAACSWKGQSPDSSHQVRVDFERVVSYDPAVSDDNRAQEVFAEKQAATSVPVAPGPGDAGPEGGTTASPSATESAGAGATPDLETRGGKGTQAPGDPEGAESSGQPSDDASPDSSPDGSADGPANDPDGSPSGSASTAGLEPRVLEGLGNAAFIDDVLGRAGNTAQRRTVSVVFRTSNVIVTVVYAEQPALVTEVPDSKELQEKAQSVAGRLAELFDE